MGALVLAGCSSGGGPKATGSTQQPQGPTLLTFAVYGPPQVVTAYAKIAANFTSMHPGTVVNVRPYDTAEAAHDALETSIADGTPPDAFLSPLQDLPGLIRTKSVRRLDELLGEREVDFGDGYQRYSLEAFSSANALQCMPVDVSPMVVYYNTNLVDLTKLGNVARGGIKPGGGWSLDEFAAAARNASVRRVRGVYVAPTLEQIAPFLWSGGGNVVDDQDKPTTLTLSKGSDASSLEKLLELVRDPQATFNEKQLANKSVLQRFESGSLAMMLGYRDLTPVLRAQPTLSFNVMPMPSLGTKATIGRSTGLCLSSASKHPAKTADFLAYAVSDAASRLLAETGYTVPTDLDVVHSEAYLQTGQMPANPEVFSANVRYIRELPTVDAWKQVAAQTEPLLTRLFYDALIDPLSDRLKAIDAVSAPIFVPPTISPSPTPSPTPAG
ncbi:MAG: ABC transporter substrate-binding protein [Marmoricola sp.]